MKLVKFIAIRLLLAILVLGCLVLMSCGKTSTNMCKATRAENVLNNGDILTVTETNIPTPEGGYWIKRYSINYDGHYYLIEKDSRDDAIIAFIECSRRP